jgi:hypothetical protein
MYVANGVAAVAAAEQVSLIVVRRLNCRGKKMT